MVSLWTLRERCNAVASKLLFASRSSCLQSCQRVTQLLQSVPLAPSLWAAATLMVSQPSKSPPALSSFCRGQPPVSNMQRKRGVEALLTKRRCFRAICMLHHPAVNPRCHANFLQAWCEMPAMPPYSCYIIFHL